MATLTAERPDAVYTRPWLYPAQQAAIFHPARYVLVEASTKSGKTVGCLAWLLEQSLALGPGQNTWWVAPIYAQARIAFRRMKFGLPHTMFVANESELTITLANGAVVWFKGADNADSLYGEDVFAAVVDEASRVREDAWHAVRTTLTATRGRVRIIGNVKGRRNWAYKLARRAESGEAEMHYARITASDAVAGGVLQSEEIEDARRTLPESVFRELYLAEPSDDGGNPFGLDAIRACVRPMAAASPFVWGIDLAKSIDYTVCIALDGQGSVCRFARYQKPWQDTIADVRERIGRAPALVDSTGVGDPVLEALQAGASNYGGFKFSSTSKQQLMEGLAVAIQQGAIHFPDGPIVTELEQFEYAYTRTGVRYSAPEGLHDDCVMALALAWHQYSDQVQAQRSGAVLRALTGSAVPITVQHGGPAARDPLASFFAGAR